MRERRRHDEEVEDLVRGEKVVERPGIEALWDAVRAARRRPLEVDKPSMRRGPEALGITRARERGSRVPTPRGQAGDQYRDGVGTKVRVAMIRSEVEGEGRGNLAKGTRDVDSTRRRYAMGAGADRARHSMRARSKWTTTPQAENDDEDAMESEGDTKTERGRRAR